VKKFAVLLTSHKNSKMFMNCSVSIVTELTGWTTGILLPVEAGIFSLRHCVQTGSEAHPTSYPVVTGSSFPGVKVNGV